MFNAFQMRAKGGIVAEVRFERQRIDKKADQRFGFRLGASGDGRAD